MTLEQVKNKVQAIIEENQKEMIESDDSQRRISAGQRMATAKYILKLINQIEL